MLFCEPKQATMSWVILYQLITWKVENISRLCTQFYEDAKIFRKEANSRATAQFPAKGSANFQEDDTSREIDRAKTIKP